MMSKTGNLVPSYTALMLAKRGDIRGVHMGPILGCLQRNPADIHRGVHHHGALQWGFTEKHRGRQGARLGGDPGKVLKARSLGGSHSICRKRRGPGTGNFIGHIWCCTGSHAQEPTSAVNSAKSWKPVMRLM